MFDWNDEELTNIIWVETGESDDHIVPYPDQVERKPSILFGDPPKKEINQQTSNDIPPDLKNPPSKVEQGVKLESNCKCDTGEPAAGSGHTSLSGGPHSSSSSNVATGPDSVGAAVSQDLRKSSEHGSIIGDGEQGDFVDYGWASIGSFDDLDRIFSNQDPLFGDMSAGHADELWSPSKDVISSPLGITPLSDDSSNPPFGAPMKLTDQAEVKAEYMLEDTSEPFGYKSLNEIASHAPLDIQTPATSGIKEMSLAQINVGTASTTKFPSKLFSCVQANRQKRLLKAQKVGKKSEVGQLHISRRTCASSRSTLQQVNGQYATSTINPGPPLVLTQQSSLPRHEPFRQKYYPRAPLGTPFYGNLVNHYPMTSALPQFHPVDENRELMPSSYEVPSSSLNLKRSDYAAAKPLVMSPREKIEKLRRRQQMRAILAIQKQQLQFGNQVSVSENSGMEGMKIEVNESLGTLPSLELNSPAEQYNSTINMNLDSCSVESVFYQLQDTIAKLDIHIRLCIRDSLSRLARSALQRQYNNDTSSTSTTSRDEVLSSNDLVTHERYIRMPDVETDTNPIDRVVAHLLFHRPLDFSGKPSDAPDPPLSPNLPFGNTQITSPQGSETTDILSQGDQSRNCPVFVTSENVSTAEDIDGERVKVDTFN